MPRLRGLQASGVANVTSSCRSARRHATTYDDSLWTHLYEHDWRRVVSRSPADASLRVAQLVSTTLDVKPRCTWRKSAACSLHTAGQCWPCRAALSPLHADPVCASRYLSMRMAFALAFAVLSHGEPKGIQAGTAGNGPGYPGATRCIPTNHSQ